MISVQYVMKDMYLGHDRYIIETIEALENQTLRRHPIYKQSIMNGCIGLLDD